MNHDQLIQSALNEVENATSTTEIENVRIGKHITLEIEAENKNSASEKVKEACEKMLCNQIMESFVFKIEEK